MKRQRLLKACVLLATLVLLDSCGGNSLINDDEAAVYLQVSNYSYTSSQHVSVCEGEDTVVYLVVYVRPKGSSGFSHFQDVTLSRWEITPYRIDGGVASPPWVFDRSEFISGSASVSGVIYTPLHYDEPPLSYLFPENGGIDPHTGDTVIHQHMNVKLFGRTEAGKSVSVECVTDFFYACSW